MRRFTWVQHLCAEQGCVGSHFSAASASTASAGFLPGTGMGELTAGKICSWNLYSSEWLGAGTGEIIPRAREGMQMITETGQMPIDDSRSVVSWKAVLAGAIASLALTLLLLAFGVGVGFSVVSPWANQGISSTTFSIAVGVYLIVVAMLPSTIGGYITGRLRAQWNSVHAHERYFRDTAHGFLVWALATVVSAVVLGGATTSLLGGAGAAALPVATAGARAAPTDIYVDQLLRRAPAEPAAGSPGPANSNAAAPNSSGANARGNREEISRILTPALLKNGAISQPDKTYLAQVVSARTGLSQADAEKRVDQTINQAKTAADDARKSAAKFSLWLVASMLAGALAASLAAVEGGNLRNREWYLSAK
jgi:hypothetical protein